MAADDRADIPRAWLRVTFRLPHRFRSGERQ
jgi:hypothetical protein